VYGDYSSQDAARAAVKSMPASLKSANLQPWVREINSVHEDIRQSQKG
jgi:septal ring-binding cell division protein DamX